MNKILLFVDGTPRCVQAAHIAISLARQFKCGIVAQYIIDPQRVFNLEGYEGTSGLCGSGVFIESQHEIMETLTGLGESLLMSFAALAEGHSIRVEQVVDVGNTAEELKKRALGCNLIVLAAASNGISKVVADSVEVLAVSVESEKSILLMEPLGAVQSQVTQILAHLRKMGFALQTMNDLGNSIVRIGPAHPPLSAAG